MSSNGTNAKPRNGLVAALDVGTTKVCCLIARRGAEGARVIGIGHQISQGVRGGSIVDMDAAEAAIRATFASASADLANVAEGSADAADAKIAVETTKAMAAAIGITL